MHKMTILQLSLTMAVYWAVSFLFVAGLALVSAIIGGEDGTPYEFPFLISLQWVFKDGLHDKSMPFCGGTLLNENFVLTAARCRLTFSNFGFIEAVAAEHDVTVQEGPEQRRAVVRIFMHEAYDVIVGVSPNDVALLRVDKPFELNDKVKPIQLPDQLQEFKGDAILSGWGSTENTIVTEFPNKLRKIVLPLMDYETCRILWEYHSVLVRSNLCAGTYVGDQAACTGDSGGPLIKKEGERTILVGISSWGSVPSGTAFRPNVFVAVSHYINWIEKHIF